MNAFTEPAVPPIAPDWPDGLGYTILHRPGTPPACCGQRISGSNGTLSPWEKPALSAAKGAG